MNKEFWLDGFNFFHHWESTRAFLRPESGMDIVRAIDRSLRILSRHLGSKCRHSVVYLDGGLARDERRLGPLRVRYCGPGRKADDRMADDVAELDGAASMVTAVSNDRELKSRLKLNGAACLGVGEFLAIVEANSSAGGKNHQKKTGKAGKFQPSTSRRGEDAEVMREKCRSLSASEVRAWLEYFGGEE